MLPSRSICTCTSCVDVLAVEPPAALRVLAQPDASAAAAARITRAEILGMGVLLVGDPRPSNCRTKKASAGRFGAGLRREALAREAQLSKNSFTLSNQPFARGL